MKIRVMGKKAFAMVEYLALILALISALVGFNYYIQRGLQGQYRKAGETFSFGRQYSPSATLECANEGAIWYSTACFNNKVLELGCKNSVDYFSCADVARNQCTFGCN